MVLTTKATAKRDSRREKKRQEEVESRRSSTDDASRRHREAGEEEAHASGTPVPTNRLWALQAASWAAPGSSTAALPPAGWPHCSLISKI